MDNKKNKNDKYNKNKIKAVIKEWVESIVVALILALFIRTFIIQAFKIPTGSMRNTLLEGDAILVNKFIYGAKVPFTNFRLPALRQPKRGDIIVFVAPSDPKKDFIKRLVAQGGETVEIRNGSIYVNEQELTDPVFRKNYYYNCRDIDSFCKYGKRNQKILVPENSYFVLGDNSGSSQDSRYWGFVPYQNIVGKAILIYWPPWRIRILK
ncbi:MAG: signal peptidase I [Candidatus Omnitrophica bacterium]|nr:signal peptidase I [Candidatus Omnitrophota bacterium]